LAYCQGSGTAFDGLELSGTFIVTQNSQGLVWVDRMPENIGRQLFRELEDEYLQWLDTDEDEV
jgi:hypothetical protein